MQIETKKEIKETFETCLETPGSGPDLFHIGGFTVILIPDKDEIYLEAFKKLFLKNFKLSYQTETLESFKNERESRKNRRI